MNFDRLDRIARKLAEQPSADSDYEQIECSGVGDQPCDHKPQVLRKRGEEGAFVCADCLRKKDHDDEVSRRRSEWASSLARIGVPLAYRGIPSAVRLPTSCSSWLGEPWSVTIVGPTGAGKTWVAIRLLMELYCSGIDGCRFVDTASAVDLIKAEMGGNEPTPDRGLFGKLVRTGALLLDDISATRDTDYQRDRLTLLLRERYNAQSPTIITSNKATLAELTTEHLDAPIGSRLASGIVVEVIGRDRRL